MELTNGGQLYNLFLSCGLGFLLGALYDVFRVLRLVMRSRAKTVFFEDMLYFLLCAVITFFFALSINGGQLRWYLFAGSILGFAAYYLTIGRVVVTFAGAVIAFILRVWKLFWTAVFFPFRLLFRLLRRPLGFLRGFVQKSCRKSASFFKKGLKRTRSLLYNQKKRKSPNPATDGLPGVNIEGEQNQS